MADSKSRKVAILGGGAGAISTALFLTNPENPEKFDVTIYQMGWRLGGLGASGRNMDVAGRIEEHGLHLWGGFYENAFAMMHRIYQEANRPAGAPLSVVFDRENPHSTIAAFKALDNVVFGDYFNEHWTMWKVLFPQNGEVPGKDHATFPPLEDIISEIINLFWQQIPKVLGFNSLITPGHDLMHHFTSFLHSVLPFPHPEAVIEGGAPDEATLIQHSQATVNHLWNLFPPRDPRHRTEAIPILLATFDLVSQWIWKRMGDLSSHSDDERHLWQLLDVNVATIRGLLRANVIENGFEALDRLDLRVWLKESGASDLSLNSVLVRGFYDYFFSFVSGDPNHPQLSAGSALVHMIRLVYTYKGSIFWKMQAGMGDAIFAPAYEVLKRRGVKFNYFHYVDQLSLADDKKTVQTIKINRQAFLKPEVSEYQPFVHVKDLACWPNQPNWDQLVDGDELKKKGVNFENPWAKNKAVEEINLEAGKDFDLIVLAISKDALCYSTGEMQAASPEWKRMVVETQTVDTIAAQLWFTGDTASLGWTDPPSVLTGYQRPHSTWCDMSHLLPREDWPADGPKSLAYICGPMWRNTASQVPDFQPDDDVVFQASTQLKARAVTREWMLAMLGKVYPKASVAVNPSGIDFKNLYDPENRPDLGRMDFAFMHMNVTPQERYTLSLPGAQEIRMRNGRTPFTNVYAAGDWVYTLLAGCVEAAVMSGMLVSQELTGYPKEIVGYWVKPRP